MMHKRRSYIQVAIVLGLVLGLMAGCATVQHTMKTGKIPTFSFSQPSTKPARVARNPNLPPDDLKALKDLGSLDASLTLVDTLMSMIRINHLILERIQVSADAEWPDRLDLTRDSAPPHYQARLEDQVRRDFSYLGRPVRDEPSIRDGVFRWLRGVFLNNELDLVAWKVEHQRGIIDSVPHFCDGTDATAVSLAVPKECEVIFAQRDQSCPFFAQPLEDQLFRFMLDRQLDAWVETPVKDSCLVQAIATRSELYPNFRTAFSSLLPRHLARDITRVEHDLERLTRKTGELKGRIEEKKLQKKKLIDTAGRTQLDREIQALNAQVDTLQDDAKRVRSTQDRLYEQAIAEAEGTPDNTRLATQLYKVAIAANDNLKLVGGDASLALANVVQIGLQWADSPKTYFAAALTHGGYNERRLDQLVKRVATLAPNTANLVVRIADQSSTIRQKMKYLDKLMRIKALNANTG
jgi:outer membrane murein-binding lipoprotein Lpp